MRRLSAGAASEFSSTVRPAAPTSTRTCERAHARRPRNLDEPLARTDADRGRRPERRAPARRPDDDGHHDAETTTTTTDRTATTTTTTTRRRRRSPTTTARATSQHPTRPRRRHRQGNAGPGRPAARHRHGGGVGPRAAASRLVAGRTTISERYELGDRLGSGGMSTVYQATDRVLERTVAVKILAEHLSDDEKFVARFRREALAVAKLIHPNIVQVYDTGVDELPPLHRHGVRRGQVGRPAPADARAARPRRRRSRSAIQSCAGLEYAHRQGIIHRDVKPGNLMVIGGPAGRRQRGQLRP